MNDTAVAKRLGHVFRKKGGEGKYLMLYENLDSSIKDILKNAYQLEPKELPIIGMVRNSIVMLVTTRNVFYKDSAKTCCLPLRLIDSIAMDLGVYERTLQHGNKMQMDELLIELTDGQLHKITFEAGRPLFGVWNALRVAAFQLKKAGILTRPLNVVTLAVTLLCLSHAKERCSKPITFPA